MKPTAGVVLHLSLSPRSTVVCQADTSPKTFPVCHWRHYRNNIWRDNIPVAVWVTVDMEEVDKIIQWQSNDGEESFLYPANEHCMVFTGCENDKYLFADPLKEEQTTAYASQDAVRAYNEMGMQAVVIVPTSTTGFTPKQ